MPSPSRSVPRSVTAPAPAASAPTGLDEDGRRIVADEPDAPDDLRRRRAGAGDEHEADLGVIGLAQLRATTAPSSSSERAALISATISPRREATRKRRSSPSRSSGESDNDDGMVEIPGRAARARDLAPCIETDEWPVAPERRRQYVHLALRVDPEHAPTRRAVEHQRGACGPRQRRERVSQRRERARANALRRLLAERHGGVLGDGAGTQQAATRRPAANVSRTDAATSSSCASGCRTASRSNSASLSSSSGWPIASR